MKILICGKGGSGKSTVSALLARELSKNADRVLVVDTDEVIGTVPFDQEVFKACLKGERIPAIPGIKPIVDRLLAA